LVEKTAITSIQHSLQINHLTMSTTMMEDAAIPVAAPTMEEPPKRLMITKMVRYRFLGGRSMERKKAY
jgi:hypothetical protein